MNDCILTSGPETELMEITTTDYWKRKKCECEEYIQINKLLNTHVKRGMTKFVMNSI